MAISSIGVGSNLPLGDLLENLRTAENQTLALIQTRATKEQSRLSAYGTIKSSIEALKTASEALGKADTYGALKSSVGGDAFTAAVTNKGIAGQYTVSVTQLAKSQSLVAAGRADPKTAIAAGTGTVSIQIKLENDKTETLTPDAADTSLNAIVKAINANPKLGVNATIVNVGGTEPHRLLLTASATGTEAAIKEITVTGSTELQEILGYNSTDGTMEQKQAAANAILEINGIEIESQSNTVTDVIEGVTLTLAKETEAGKTQALTVSRDDTVTSKAVTTFVNAYNNLQNIIKTLTSYNVDSQKGSALTGDSIARQVQTQVRDALNIAESSGAIRSLSQMGISTNPSDGVLKIDDAKLATALKDNMADVQALFSGDKGISAKLGSMADIYVKSGGVFSTTTDSITKTLKDLEKQYAAAQLRIDAKMESYRTQFTKLDSMVAQMNSVSSYLTQQLSMLGNIGKEK